MAKPATNPIILNKCLSLKISDLRKRGILQDGKMISGTIQWTKWGEIAASITATVNMYGDSKYLQLDYMYNEQPIVNKIQLVSIKANIGNGLCWYFVCPQTGTRCSTLHMVRRFFCHRSAFEGALYKKQTLSHNERSRLARNEWLWFGDKVKQQRERKYFRTHYNGIPTKTYKKMLDGLSSPMPDEF